MTHPAVGETSRYPVGAKDVPTNVETNNRPAVVEPGPIPIAGFAIRRSAPLRRSAQTDALGGAEVPAPVVDSLRRRRGGGDPLPASLADPIGRHLGTDLSSIRVHADPAAAELARSMQSAAFTHGNDIYFGPGQYRPTSDDGRRMLAHEIGHVAAQRSGADRAGPGPLTIGRANDPAEAAADRTADSVMTALRRCAVGNGDTVAGETAAIDTAAGDTAAMDTASWDRAGADGPGALRRCATVDHTARQHPIAALRRWPWSKKKSPGKGGGESEPEVGYPKLAPLGTGSETVRLEKKADEDEALEILAELKSTYGIELSSATAVQGIKNQYGKVAKEVVDGLQASTWSMRELRALRTAVAVYAPILGTARGDSTEAASAQGVTTIGKVKQAIDQNNAKGELDTSTLGEYFSGDKSVGLFDAGTDHVDKSFRAAGKKKSDVQTSLNATAIHEMAHGLVAPGSLQGWVAGLDYWTGSSTRSRKRRAEAPPTSYGKTNAAEDLCESFAMYFVNEPMLKKKAPRRHALVATIIAGWKPEQQAAVISGAEQAPGTEKPTGNEQPAPEPVEAGT